MSGVERSLLQDVSRADLAEMIRNATGSYQDQLESWYWAAVAGEHGEGSSAAWQWEYEWLRDGRWRRP